MTKTDYIKQLISETELNLKAFAKETDIPYTTLRSMLDRGIENASVNNVIKVCTRLGISVESLYSQSDDQKITKDESDLLDDYEKLNILGKKEARKRVSELTEISKYTLQHTYTTIAAHDDDLTEDEKTEMDKRIFEALKKR